MKKARVVGKPKSVNLQLLDHDHRAYELLRMVRDKWHQEIDQAKIALAFWKKVKADRDGILKLGRIHHTSELHRELAPWDFVILLNETVWMDPDFGDKQKKALLDHELCHATIATDKAGNARKDERGRLLYRMRRHDIEEFRAVVKRHGCYKADLEEFARILLKKVDAPLLAKLDDEPPLQTSVQ
jgi:Putative phage metallopeptidase